ncbi:MAG: fumarate reductase subunit C [Alphaproteobacteria bacterium]|nr:fumarate reductase subunit C [Alphaproteobacteria bacterium]
MMGRKPYIREVSKTTWWLKHPRYMNYMLREVTSLFIGLYTAVAIDGVWRLQQGREAWEHFIAWTFSTEAVFMHIVFLVFAVIHTTTWFNVTPKAMPMHVGDEPLPDAAIIGAHYAGWVVVSVLALLIAGK